VMDSGTSEAEF